MTNQHSPKKWLIYAAVFVAAAALGGILKFPGPVGSIALDSAPGYFLAAYIHPVLGGIVGSLGHLASAATAGFPLGYVHIWVAAQMFFWCLAFGLITQVLKNKWSLVPASLVAIFLNGMAGPLMLGYLRVVDMSLAEGVIWVLTIASIANILVAAIAVRLITVSKERRQTR